MKVNSQKETVFAAAPKIFSLITNCKNFGEFLPDQIENWEAGDDYCTFSFQGLINLTLRILEKEEFSKVVYRAENTQNIPVSFTIQIEDLGEECLIWIDSEMDLPIYLQGMVKKTFQKFVDAVVLKIKIEAEK